MNLDHMYQMALERTAQYRGSVWQRLLAERAPELLVERGVRIRQPSQVRIGKRCWLKENVLLDARTDEVHGITIGDDVIVRAGAYLDAYGGRGHIWLGDRVGLGQFVYIGGNGGVRLGNDVMISGHCYLTSATHKFALGTGVPYQEQGETRVGIDIGNNTWIAANSVVIDGVVIGANTVVGAGSVVTRSLPPGVLAVGAPARVIRPIDTAEKSHLVGRIYPDRVHDQETVVKSGRTRRPT